MSAGGTDRLLAVAVFSAKEHRQDRIDRLAGDFVGLLDLFDGTRDNTLIEETILALAVEAGDDWAAVRRAAEARLLERGDAAPEPWQDNSFVPPTAGELAEWESYYGRDD